MSRSILFLIAFWVARHGAAQQPNVLLIIADDLGLDPVPGYMAGPVKAAMPNLGALMAQGLTFDNVWVNPLCSPTRSTILTGRYGFRTGVLNPGDLSLLPSNEVTLHQYLTNNGSGYASCIIGKWHLGGLQPDATYPNTMGVPHFAGVLTGAVSNYNMWPLTIDGTTTPSTDYITTALTDRAIDWIDQQTTPWLCWLAYTAPHTPLHRPPLFMHEQGPLPTDPDSIAANPLPYYLAMVESVDYELGRLLGSLTPAELANTLVIFIGDNGTDMDVIQSPYTPGHAKGTLFEGGVRAPLVMAGPGITRAAEREGALVNSTDLFATIVEVTGAVLPVYEDSRSLLPMFTQSGISVRSCLRADVSQGAVSGYAVRDERWKLIDQDNGSQLFFDLLNDPWESTNLLSGGLSIDEQLAYDALAADCASPLLIDGPGQQGLFVVHPNPAQDMVSVQAPLPLPITVRVCDALGRSLFSRSITNELDLRALAPGLYFLDLVQADRRTMVRLVKE
ncbi:MAG: sulfatase-like hydrolase/transferase [Flavobacteriales bacterium]|nr:MAG: sulfatase-like hydrolase/transferase [Flavobacteriales bacterium]